MDNFIWKKSPITQPYAYITGGSFSDSEQIHSPDPLITYRWEETNAADELEIFLRKPVAVKTDSSDSFQKIHTFLDDNPNVLVTGTGMIMLDFGVEFAGWLEIDSPDLNGVVTLGVSEYNEPAFVNLGPQSPAKTAIPVPYGHSYRLELNSELYEGVRFAFIHIAEFVRPFHITGIRLVCQTKPTNYNGSFNSDHEMLNRIWYTAAYVVRLNLKRDYLSAILVDRGDRHSWTGDAYPAQVASLAAFANYDFVLQNLRFTASNSNGIESYELYWIYSLIDYYRYSGDEQGVRSLLREAIMRLDHAYEIYDNHPKLVFFGWDERLGAGFENPDIAENHYAYRMLAIRAWKEFSKLLVDLGEQQLAKQYAGYAATKTAELHHQVQWYGSYGMHAFADAINADVVSESLLQQLYDQHYSDRVNRLSYSPFNQYFILQAMAKANRYDDAIASIVDMWGGQIAYGGTAFFETYRPEWNEQLALHAPVPNNQAGYTSLAHPWGASVLSWLSEEVLGIKPTSPGFATFNIKPHLGRQLTRVSGSMPTPYGLITASFDTVTGECQVTIPPHTVANIGIPKVEKRIVAIRLNEISITPTAEDEDFMFIDELVAGTYTIGIHYEGETPAFIDLKRHYPAKWIAEDDRTKGSWGGKYGSDGYLLFSYDGDGKHITRLPDYVRDITCNKAGSMQWTDASNDERALMSSPIHHGLRKLGAHYTLDPHACEQTFTVDIALREERSYTVALYFVDWDDKGRRIAVELFDKQTLELIAPVRIIDRLSGGEYLICHYHKSVRIRINQVRGANATLSAIFFGAQTD